MIITNNQQTYSIQKRQPSFRALYLDKRLQKGALWDLSKKIIENKNIQEAAAKYEVILKLKHFFGNILGITAQAGEGIKKGLFGTLILTGAKSEKYLFKSEEDIKDDINLEPGEKIIKPEPNKFETLLRDGHLDVKKITADEVKEISIALQDKPEVMKEIFTFRPVNNDKDDLNIVERFVSDKELAPIFKKVLGDETFAEYEAVEKERLEIERKQASALIYRITDESGIVENWDLLSKYPAILDNALKKFSNIDINCLSHKDLKKIHAIYEQGDIENYTDLMLHSTSRLEKSRMHIVQLKAYGHNDIINHYFDLIKDNVKLLLEVKYNLNTVLVETTSYKIACNSLKTSINNMLPAAITHEAEKLDNMSVTYDNIMSTLNDTPLDSIKNSEKFLSNVIDFIMTKATPEEKNSIVDKLRDIKNYVDFNKKDDNGISILEKVMNAEDAMLLTLINNQRLNYYPELDYTYANISDPIFKRNVDLLVLKFPDIEDAIRLSSKTAFDKASNQLKSPLYKCHLDKDLIKDSSPSMLAYIKVKYGKYFPL